MTSQSEVWRAVLNAAMHDGGPAALDNYQLLRNLCADLAPDDPDANYLLRTAAEFGVARRLQEQIGHGFRPAQAVDTVSALLAQQRYLPQDASLALVREFSHVLGHVADSPTDLVGADPARATNPTTEPAPPLVPASWSELTDTRPSQHGPRVSDPHGTWTVTGHPEAVSASPSPASTRRRKFVVVASVATAVALLAGGAAAVILTAGSGSKSHSALPPVTTSSTVATTSATTTVPVATGAATVPATASSTTSTTVRPTTVAPATTPPVTTTQTNVFAPWGFNGLNPAIKVVGNTSGTCFSESDAVATAYRCLAGNDIMDPCFPSDLPQTTTVLACATSPWSGVRLFTLQGALPTLEPESGSSFAFPWAIQLVNGRQCILVQGASSSVGGAELAYFCADTQSFTTAVNEQSEPWTVEFDPSGTSATLTSQVVAVAWS